MGDGVIGSAAGLVVLDDPCRGCGACCEYVGAPPGYAPAYGFDGETPEGWYETDDGKTWRAMPAELRDALGAYYRAVAAGRLEDRERHGQPCLWYDPASLQCSQYPWRPWACRDFAPGGADCLGIREYAGR